MKRITLITFLFLLVACGSDEPNPCLMAEEFIEKDLNYPEEAEISILDCIKEDNPSGGYTILQKVSASNAFGIKKEYIYKLNIIYIGGITTDIDNWTMLSIKSEEYKR